eukprot:TRINITY_DN7896_c0_g1_i6.p1 TRINITY_DN7896_c0_g1~~TRINITY_DN7896_c0_g1_i6.p1  ORF type:complete len:1747 (+),score=304.22 TRINITY_DN7896_c0_g1_i6:73-5313(+)
MHADCVSPKLSTDDLQIIKSGRVNEPNEKGWTMIHFTAEGGIVVHMKYLLDECGGDAEALTNSGSSALHIAALGGCFEMVLFLLERHPDLNKPNGNKELPLACLAMSDWRSRESDDDKMKFSKAATALWRAARVPKTGENNASAILNRVKDFLDTCNPKNKQSSRTAVPEPPVEDSESEETRFFENHSPTILTGKESSVSLQETSLPFNADPLIQPLRDWFHKRDSPYRGRFDFARLHDAATKGINRTFLNQLEGLKNGTLDLCTDNIHLCTLLGLPADDVMEMIYAGLLYCTQTSYNVTEIQRHMIESNVSKTLYPLIFRLEQLLKYLPKQAGVRFRGDKQRVSEQFPPGEEVVLNQFTSVSCQFNTGKRFTNKGTFVFTIGTAAKIAFLSPYKEGESLFDPTTRFRVCNNISPNLLRMLDCDFDIVVLCESVEVDPTRHLKWIYEVNQILFEEKKLFKTFSDTYLEPRLRSQTDIANGDLRSSRLTEVLSQWLSHSKGRLCVQGEAGSGKTSAALRAMSWLSEQVSGTSPLKETTPAGEGDTTSRPSDEAGGWFPTGTTTTSQTVREENGVNRCTSQLPVFPIFLSLPSIAGDVLSEESLVEDAIFDQISASASTSATKKAILSHYRVCVILDSLDEIKVSNNHLSIPSIIKLNPFLAECWVMMTVRTDFLTEKEWCPEGLLKTPTSTPILDFTMCLFSKEEKCELTKKLKSVQSSASKKEEEKHKLTGRLTSEQSSAAEKVEELEGGGFWVRNPFLLSMALQGHEHIEHALDNSPVKGSIIRKVSERHIYEAYLIHCIRSRSRRHTETALSMDEVERRLEIGEDLACSMLMKGSWKLTILDIIGTNTTTLSDDMKLVLQCLPLRIDNISCKSSVVTFQHTTLAEYLVARKLVRKPAEALRGPLSERSFTREVPFVLKFFSSCVRNIFNGPAMLRDEILPLVFESRDDQSKEAVSSNALALLVCARSVLDCCDFGGIRIKDADLSSMSVEHCSFKNSIFLNCLLQQADFFCCDFTGYQLSRDCRISIKLSNKVISASMSPDGTKLAVGMSNDTIRLFDISTGEEEFCIKNGGRMVTYCEDGKHLIGCNRKRVFLWDTLRNRTKALAQEDVKFTSFDSIAFSPKMKFVVNEDETTYVKDFTKTVCGGEVKTTQLENVPLTVAGLVFFEENYILGEYDHQFYVWNDNTGELVKGYPVSTQCYCEPRHSIFIPGPQLVSGRRDNTIMVWDGSAGVKCHPCIVHFGHEDQVTTISLSKGIVASGSDDGVVILSDLLSTHMRRSNTYKTPVRHVSLTPDARQLITASDRQIDIWDVKKFRNTELEKAGHYGSCNCVSFSPLESKYNYILSGGSDCTIRLCDAVTGIEIFCLGTTDTMFVEDQYNSSLEQMEVSPEEGTYVGPKNPKNTNPISCVAFDPSGEIFASGTVGGAVRLWNTSDGSERTLRKVEDESPVKSICFSPDGETFVSACSDGIIYLWETYDKRDGNTNENKSEGIRRSQSDAYICSVGKFEGHSKGVTGTAISPNGKLLASSGRDGTVRFWNFETQEELQSISVSKLIGNDISCMAVDKSWTYLACGSGDDDKHIVGIWKLFESLEGDDFKKPELMHTLKHDTCVLSVSFSPDGEWLLTGGKKGVVRMWDVASGNEISCLGGHSGDVNGVAFSPGGCHGCHVASASSDQTIRLYEFRKAFPEDKSPTPPSTSFGWILSYFRKDKQEENAFLKVPRSTLFSNNSGRTLCCTGLRDVPVC